jgi:hypothetical protein
VSAPASEQRAFIERSAKSGMKFIMIACPACGWSMPFNPQHRDGAPEKRVATLQMRCPIETCTGWVCEVEDYWGCGECGNVWPHRMALERAIAAVVKKCSYRAACYVKRGMSWAPAALDQEPPDYEDLVRAEWNKRTSAGRSREPKPASTLPRDRKSERSKKKRK